MAHLGNGIEAMQHVCFGEWHCCMHPMHPCMHGVQQDDLRKQLADSEKQREVLAARDDENARRLRALETKATASQRELEVEKKNASVW